MDSQGTWLLQSAAGVQHDFFHNLQNGIPWDVGVFHHGNGEECFQSQSHLDGMKTPKSENS
jgi:hypothetical protein